jgi:hypothetical protein
MSRPAEALPDELVERLVHPPEPPSPAWLPELAELVAEKLRPIIEAAVQEQAE